MDCGTATSKKFNPKNYDAHFTFRTGVINNGSHTVIYILTSPHKLIPLFIPKFLKEHFDSKVMAVTHTLNCSWPTEVITRGGGKRYTWKFLGVIIYNLSLTLSLKPQHRLIFYQDIDREGGWSCLIKFTLPYRNKGVNIYLRWIVSALKLIFSLYV